MITCSVAAPAGDDTRRARLNTPAGSREHAPALGTWTCRQCLGRTYAKTRASSLEELTYRRLHVCIDFRQSVLHRCVGGGSGCPLSCRRCGSATPLCQFVGSHLAGRLLACCLDEDDVGWW